MPRSRETLLVQLFAIGDSVEQLRTELVEVGGALIEAERRRLTAQLVAIQMRHAQLVERLSPPTEH